MPRALRVYRLFFSYLFGSLWAAPLCTLLSASCLWFWCEQLLQALGFCCLEFPLWWFEWERPLIGSHIWALGPQLVALGRLRTCSLTGGSMSLRMGFESWKPHSTSSSSCLLQVYSWGCEHSAFGSGHHACHLLSCFPTVMGSYPLNCQPDKSLLLLVSFVHYVLLH